MIVQEFFDEYTFTLTYIVFDKDSKDCVIIDPVYDYSINSSTIKRDSISLLEKFISNNQLNLKFILETHAHADHFTAAYELKKLYPSSKIGIGKKVTKVQDVFKGFFNLKNLKTDGSQFDLLLEDKQVLECGGFKIEVLETPGHTPACCSFLINDTLFCGDLIFMPDLGCGRCDFPEGSSTLMYQSITEKIYELDDKIIIMTGHDYPGDKKYRYKSTVLEQKKCNKALPLGMSLEDFVKKREGRDKELDSPRLLLPAIQVNIQAGKLPDADESGKVFLKIPITIY